MKSFHELAELISASTVLFKNYGSYAKRKGFPTPPGPAPSITGLINKFMSV